MRSRNMLRRYCLIGSFLFAIYVLYIIYDGYNATNCSDAESKKVIADVCEHHLAGDAAGNLCPDLCTYSKIKYHKCANYRGGKQVLISKWDQVTTVLKSKRPYYSDYDSVPYPDDKESGLPPYDFIKILVKDSIEFSFNVKIPTRDVDDLPTEMWTRDLKQFVKRNADDPDRVMGAYQSLHSLMQQDEYQFMKYFQSAKHIPQIYGSCGHLYAVEYLPPGKNLSPRLFKPRSLSPWAERVAIAIKLLKLVESFRADFHQELHICDVKGDNFGVGDDGNAKLIDTDAAFFDSKLKDLLVNETCSEHEDCNFFDCKGFCNYRTRKCTNKRINSNLQSICAKIFTSGIENVYSGLLDNPPTSLPQRDEIVALVKHCVHNQYNSYTGQVVDQKTEEQIISKFISLLQ